jgi:hypothetical protein
VSSGRVGVFAVQCGDADFADALGQLAEKRISRHDTLIMTVSRGLLDGEDARA